MIVSYGGQCPLELRSEGRSILAEAPRTEIHLFQKLQRIEIFFINLFVMNVCLHCGIPTPIATECCTLLLVTNRKFICGCGIKECVLMEDNFNI